MSDNVIIFDTTLRDGEQSPGCSMTTPEKLKIAEALVELGVDVIEAGFPIASPGDFEAVRAVAQRFGDRARICGLARCRREDIERAGEALRGVAKSRIHVFLATSPIHRQFKLKMAEQEIVKAAVEHVKLARSLCEDVEFSPEDAARTELDFLVEVVEKAIEAGATTVNIPDTVGYATPTHYFKVISHLKQHVSNINRAIISTHCHNDLGLAVANSLAAVEAGARQIECTINGLGERAGNAALEEIVMALKTRHDYYGVETNIHTPKLCGLSRLVSSTTGMLVQRNKAIVGQNAFAHEAGIHQDGVLKERTTYEIMRAEDVGFVGANLVLGKHSGRHAIRSRVIELGYQLPDAQLQQVYDDFIALADKKKNVYDADIVALIDNRMNVTVDRWKLIRFHIAAGTGTIPTATVELRDESAAATSAGSTTGDVSVATYRDAAIGDGPVDAVCKAMERIVGISAELKDYQVRAVSGGEDAQGEASVEIVYQGRRYHGKAVSTDVIEASALAYLKALNKAISEQPTSTPAHGV
ncbi:2-isopropylmalate synthase [Schlesneria paludicola]|uniref:2-isopropylmalate synthase n=1 Tax=Schlesneria paludicola TaxID=360056 RepID=UPI000299F939|nr:2-isopropylmalate synthase [Schlesneria paludicola]